MSRTGIYPGSFDPIHKGHIDIINRATKLVDKLYIAVADSPHKSPLFDLDERKEMIENEFSSNDKIEVIAFDNLLIDIFRASSIINLIFTPLFLMRSESKVSNSRSFSIRMSLEGFFLIINSVR